MPLQFVYVLEAVGTGLAKVGCGQNPKARRHELGTLTPHELRFRHVYSFPTVDLAFRAERLILNGSERVRGEWVVLDDGLDALVSRSAMPHGAAVTRDFLAERLPGVRAIPDTPEHADLAERVSLDRLFAPPDPRIAVAMDDIERGFGWEDVLVKRGIPREVYWQAAARLGLAVRVAA